jgi:catechol 2,3-dioxygenase-like lactoylglutathione lyase family enzyme
MQSVGLVKTRAKGYGVMAGVKEAEDRARAGSVPVSIESVSAITLATIDMARSVRFYRALGFALHYGGEDAEFSSFSVGSSYLNVCAASPGSTFSWWGRVIFHVSDVDAVYARAVHHELSPQFAPRDASWGERYFHLTDPDGHELSFARPLPPSQDR